MVTTPKYIYNLIAMSDNHIKAWESRRLKEEEYSNSVKGMSKEDKKVFNREWRENNKGFDPELSLGKAYRGTFTDLDLLIKIIEDQNDPYGICECYYTYLLIEKHDINCIDGLCWATDSEDAEIWYKMNDEDRYVQIDKPKCFQGTCNFT
jgi:hypothetical protein